MKINAWLGLSLAAIVAVSACKKEDDNDDNNTPTATGIQGKWQSSGSDVAPLLVTLFQTDSIYAEFNTNNTYLVEQYSTSGALVTLSGTYTQQKATTDIWTIEVNQTVPATLTSEGIFKVDGSTMTYEIVQTQPDIQAVPPTPAAGFGSTNGGALGTINVQTYRKVN